MADKSITKVIEEVCEEICDKYCKHPSSYGADEVDKMWEEVCENCPLNKLM